MIEAKRLQRLFDRVCETRRNCRFDDIRSLLYAIGFSERYGRGSHVKFKLGVHNLLIPSRSPVKRVYVDIVIKTAREILYHEQA